MTTTSSIPLSERSGGTYERLVEAAVEVFVERGYEGARVQDIARRAGLTTGAIYGRFGSKAGLLGEALRARGGSDVRSISSALSEELTGTEFFRVLGSRLVATPVVPRNSLFLDAVAAARRDPRLAAVLRQHLEELGERLGAHIEEARESGGIDPALSTDVLSRFCLSILFGTVTLKVLGLTAPSVEEWAEVVDRVVGAMGPARGA